SGGRRSHITTSHARDQQNCRLRRPRPCGSFGDIVRGSERLLMNSLANRSPRNPRPGTAVEATQGQAPWAGALTAVLQPTAEASGLPNVAYTDDAFLGVERDRIFGSNWACVGFACDLPAPGDVRPFDL